ncbi:hypothetical protein [Ignavibacterium sp.]|uniref:hypothetical protein n=1 Tax=Ignavibacterium sp. TaxID=2651167 RepID=UPI0021FE0C09|nr:hypothetical protein [Ignavibacterium sp.]BDQ03395.1 MAG: hypothetical protein KatS3mg037_1970 [Ignavibacterium sp.]
MKDYLNLFAIILIIFLLMSVDCSKEISTTNSDIETSKPPSQELLIVQVGENLSKKVDSVAIIEFPTTEIQIHNHYRSKAMCLRGIDY